MVQYSTTIILYMITGVEISCKNNSGTIFERVGAGKEKKAAGQSDVLHITQCIAVLIA